VLVLARIPSSVIRGHVARAPITHDRHVSARAPSLIRPLPPPPSPLSLPSSPARSSGRDARRKSGARNARATREKEGSHDGRSQPRRPRGGRSRRGRIGPRLVSSRLISSRIASSRLVSFAHPFSPPRSRNTRRGCVTHSTRASIARGCRRWRPSPSFSLCVRACVRAFVRVSFLVISFFLYSLSYRDYRPASRIPRTAERSVSLVLGGYGKRARRRTSHPTFPRDGLLSRGYLGSSRVASRLSLGSARLGPRTLNNAITAGAYPRMKSIQNRSVCVSG